MSYVIQKVSWLKKYNPRSLFQIELSPAASKGKPAVMFLIKGETTGSPLALEDVVNNGKTCQTIPAFPTTQKNTPVIPVTGSKLPKLIAGNKVFQLKPGTTMWTEKVISEDAITGDYHAFDIGDLGLWLIPYDWGSQNPSKILDMGLVWNGLKHKFSGKIWSGFAVNQVSPGILKQIHLIHFE